MTIPTNIPGAAKPPSTTLPTTVPAGASRPAAEPQLSAPGAGSHPTPTPTPTPARPLVAPQTPKRFRPNILVLGDSGTGKTSSLRNLNWADVEFVDSEQKGLPFAGVPVNYSAPMRTADIEAAMFKSKRPIVVLDSLTKYIELLDAEMNAAFAGFDVWKNYNNRLADFLNRCKSTTQTFILTAIPEILTVNSADGMGMEAVRRVRTRGKQWEGMIEKEFAFVFFTLYKTVTTAGAAKTSYMFQTNAAGMNRAKSPMGCFADLYIDNDIAAALAKMETYYAA